MKRRRARTASLASSAAVVVAIAVVLVAWASLQTTSGAQAQAEPLVYRGNARTAAYGAAPIRNTPGTAWEHQLPRNSLFAAPLLSGDVLYVTSQDGVLRALNRNTGQEVGTFRLGSNNQMHATPVLAGGVLYLGTEQGLFAIDAATAAQRWTFRVSGNIFTSPAVANGALYFASQEGTVYAVDMASGAEEWRFAAGGNTIDPLAYSDGLLYVASGTSLYALDANSGEQVWVVKRGDWFGPLVSGGVVYAANDDLNLYALDAETGAEVWKAPTGARPSSPAALAEGIIYSGTTANQLVAFDARTGQQLWKFDTDDWPSNPSVVSGVVYVGTTNHENREGERHLYAIDARSGQELWRFKADSRLFAPPAFADGVMYLQSWHGKIYALDASIAPASPTTQATLTPSSASASPTALASATRQAVPTVALPGSGSRTFPETGKTVRGLFLDYWDTHGGLPQQGFPISEVIGEVSDLDGKPYTVQYFERAVFEYHPENQPPYNVLLSQLGTFQYRKKYPNGAPNQQPNTSPGSVLFPETGKRVGGRFLQYWQQNGGLAQQGFPISDEFIEKSDLDGKTYRVQYFERAVFEMHPENQPPFDVLLSQLGTFQYREKYGER